MQGSDKGGTAMTTQIDLLRHQLSDVRRACREIDHRTANSLQIAASLLRAQRARSDDPLVRREIEVASGRIAALARMHRFFQLNGVTDAVALDALLGTLARDLGAALGLRIRVEAVPVEVPARMAMKLSLSVNELAVNAQKHAYGGQGGPLLVRCALDEGRLALAVSDRGRGLPDGFDPDASEGLGLTVVRGAAMELGGTLRAANGPDGGAVFTLAVPLP